MGAGRGLDELRLAPKAAGRAPIDSYFAATGMTYVAAAGDSGAQVLWPAVSPNVRRPSAAQPELVRRRHALRSGLAQHAAAA